MKRNRLVLFAALLGALVALVVALVPSAAARQGASKRVCLVIGGDGVTDHGFNQSAWEGAQAAAKKVGWTAKYALAQQDSDALPAITAFTQQPCELIITVGFNFTDSTKQAAAANPDQKFAIIDVSYQPPIKNVRGIVFDESQSSFLAGYLAAGYSKTGVVGVYGGVKIPPVTLFMDGYAQGVTHYNRVHHKTVKLLGWDFGKQDGTFVGNFTDVAKGKQIAEALMQQNADVIFGLGGNPDFGAAQAIASEGHGKVSMIWPNTDGCVAEAKYCSIFLTSVLKDEPPLIARTINDIVKGRFTGGRFLGILKNNGVGIAPYHRFAKKVPASLQKEIATLRARIASGKLKVVSTSKP